MQNISDIPIIGEIPDVDLPVSFLVTAAVIILRQNIRRPGSNICREGNVIIRRHTAIVVVKRTDSAVGETGVRRWHSAYNAAKIQSHPIQCFVHLIPPFFILALIRRSLPSSAITFPISIPSPDAGYRYKSPIRVRGRNFHCTSQMGLT